MALRVWDGGDDSDGSTWAKAYVSITNAAVLGAKHSINDVWVASDHTEQVAATIALSATASTLSDPLVFISTKRADDTYETMTTGGGVIESTGAADDITFNAHMKFFGVKFDSGDEFIVGNGGDSVHFQDCTIISADVVTLYARAFFTFESCTLTLSGEIVVGGGIHRFTDCTFTAAAAAGIFDIGSGSGNLIVEDSDLSTEADLFVGLNGWSFMMTIRRCKLAAGWRADLVDNFDAPDAFLLIEGSEADGAIGTDPIIGLQLFKNYYGTIIPEKTFYYQASDGTTSYSWEMETNAKVIEALNPLRSPCRAMWVSSGAQTVTFNVACDTDALNNDDFWVEMASPNEATPATAEGKFQESHMASPHATPAALAAGNNWTGNPTNEYKIEFSIDPEEDGWIVYHACHAKPSTVIYFDPRPVIS